MTYKIGECVRGTVTGIQPYGIFVEVDDHTQGLIHISEIKHAYVDNVHELVEIGDEIDVMIMDIDEYSKKISLSIRSLLPTTNHPFANPKKNPRFDRKRGIGFQTIDGKMAYWIDKALKEIHDANEREK